MLKHTISLLLCICMLFSIMYMPLPSAFDNNRNRSLSDKIVYESADILYSSSYDTYNNTELEVDSVSIFLEYEDSFSCEHTDFTTEEELTEHRKELRKYYAQKNKQIIDKIKLSGHTEMYYSNYGPFIEYRYNSYKDFVNSDYKKLEKNNSSDLNKVYVHNNYKIDSSATIDTNHEAPHYLLNRVYEDLGIPNSTTLTGQGVRVGILEEYIPSRFTNFSNTTYEVFGSITQPDIVGIGDHAYEVASLLGGVTGVAPNVSFYFTEATRTPPLTSVEWLLDKDVHIINVSMGMQVHHYSHLSAYFDYLIQSTKVTIVAAAGNNRNNTYELNGTDFRNIECPGKGINVITVASSTRDKTISYFSAFLNPNIEMPELLKPTLTAPGTRICRAGDKTTNVFSGTSASAPLVSGIIALLMQQAPMLKAHPEMIMSILSASCTNLVGQGTIYDIDAGFGLVNFTNALNLISKTYNFTFNPSTKNVGDTLCTRYVTIPAGETLRLRADVLFNSTTNSPPNVSDEASNPIYPQVRVDIKDNATGTTILGSYLSNFSYIDYTNNYSADRTYTITVKMASNPNVNGLHYASLTSSILTESYLP